MRNSVLALMTVVLSSTSGYVSGYHIEPVKASWSGWTTLQNSHVSEVITANFDSLSYVELFAGAKGNGGAYRAGVWLDGSEIMWSNGTQTQNESWVKFENWNTHIAYTKGKRYEFRFTRSGGDSIQYYYDTMCGYHYGQMIAPYPPAITPDFGLAMRCYGRMKAVDSTYWGVVPMVPDPWESGLYPMFAARAREARVGAAVLEISWDRVQPSGLNSFEFGPLDDKLLLLTESAGCRVLCGALGYCAESASSRYDSTVDTAYWCRTCAPRGLFYPVGHDSNYWARYLDTLVRHLDDVCDALGCDTIHSWQLWNEPNDTCVIEEWHGDPKWITGWWRRPNRAYQIGFENLRGLCSLYVRLCQVADSIITRVDGHEADTIIIGALAEVTWEDSSYLVSGKDWLRTCYEIGTQGGTVTPFWDGVSVHPYQGQEEFDPAFFKENADTLRAIMRDHHVGPLWCSEIGWAKTMGESANARNLCKTFVSAKASEALPEGGYDRTCWFLFRESSPKCGHFPLLDSGMIDPYMPFYTFRQMPGILTGKGLNGRVISGDQAVDDHTFVYEFEDTTVLKKKSWVCWQDEAVAAFTPVPVRNDEVDTVALACDSIPPDSQKHAEPTGWLNIALQPRPAFVMETGVASRPDLVVDSVKYILQSPDTVLAWVTNRGNRATPRQSLGNQPYPTWAVLYANGDSLAQQVYTDTIGVNQQITFRFNLVVAQPTPVLFAIKVNPAQTYVELGSDDNSGYRLKAQ